ncbi:SRPBCC family protein [Segniliparus rugosus]|uniref:Polyketide cyclase / dehydrase and lipid transport n=1 Tax=Segniliparus rugosus (strain ATCC BAA-974 / DSM 45345 / CCUG 50838 / CIP 108380 / JCM 13579 / CDC 945) TaxID=679197 RepID=E5XNJ2_SEGRC|nr:SRPBCC family protein [Segniliparus rugosus]EFV14104.1 hypothetical protein HMPREF9336_01021 [Segniliparus rugosus ATCC BAA-974]
MFRGQASVDIAAPAEVVYDLVADPANMSRLSPEARSVRWTGGHTSAEPGARFRGTNRSRGVWWPRTGVVTEAERGVVYAFKTERGRLFYDDFAVWRYEFERTGQSSVRVTESFVVDGARWLMALWTTMRRPQELQLGVEKTLDNLKRLAESNALPEGSL